MGRCVINTDGEHLTVQLLEENGDVFASSPVREEPPTIEPAKDSSRYFVLRVEDAATGQHAYIGIGFQERTHAFDFNSAVYEHFAWLAKQRDLAARASEPAQHHDYSLQQGQTITVNIKHKPTKRDAAAHAPGAAKPTAAGSGFLPPPPSGGSRVSLAPPPSRSAPAPAPVPAPAPAPAPGLAPAFSLDPFAGFAATAPAPSSSAAPVDPFAAMLAPAPGASAQQPIAAFDWGAPLMPAPAMQAGAPAPTGPPQPSVQDPFAIFAPRK